MTPDALPMRRRPRFVPMRAPATDAAATIVAGLRAKPPSIAPRYFYDLLGARLFEAICELPEYYPTRTEAAIFAEHGAQIATAAGQGATLIDLGAGNCEKAARLFAALRPAQYVALDIGGEFLLASLDRLQDRFPALDLIGIEIDFAENLHLPEEVLVGRRLFFYPGSSIGNFSPAEAVAFLQRVRVQAGDEGQLLIGVDLVKAPQLLNAAYDDPLGVTAAFNLNVLNNINRLAGTDFDVRDWRHVAFFNATASRIEMHLEATRDVIVRVGVADALEWAAGTRIHTESSWKYTPEGFGRLLRQAGFTQVHPWVDERAWFGVFLARA